METKALSSKAREDALREMTRGELDILVVGGGVVGTGAALDAVTRGLRTGLVEARDWASGTSSRSSKLVHGGLRYLEMLDFALVHEALRERGLLRNKLAPHLVRPVPFLYPLTHRFRERPYIGSGIALYDGMAISGGNNQGFPLHRHLTRKGVAKEAPGIRKDAMIGAIQYYDGQVDDARHTMMIARTAATYGASIANRTRVKDFVREGERVVGAVLVDLESGTEITVKAKQVINATGVWTDETQELVNARGQFKVRASKGIHLVIPKDRIQSRTGMILRTEKSVLFIIPWGRHWIIGTTDTDWTLDKAHPAATSADIDYVLGHANAVLKSPLTRADVQGVYAGLRPLLSGESESTSKLSREHVVGHPVPGLVVVAGGKYTTYRVMAKDAVDVAVEGIVGRIPESTTENVPLVGAEGYHAMWNLRQQLATQAGIHVDHVEHLLNRFGSAIGEVLDLVKADPTLGEVLPHADDYLKAEVVYAVTHEGARHLDDVLARRTRISIETYDRGTESAELVADLMGAQLDWDAERRSTEVKTYQERVAAERASQEQPDDASADMVRLQAPEIVPM
ncbi:MAG: glycerol-3-phosphate dehydrogenase/oxidase [Janthinobacterium lividum]